MTTEEIIQKLQQASAGLLMMSESDYHFEVVCWENAAQELLNPQKILELTNNSQNTLVEIVDIDYFFRNCTAEKEGYSQIKKENASKFRNLVEIIKFNLNDIKVYRLGTISIDVYILGVFNHDVVGIATKVIET